jgi:hypothetical protein
MKTLIMIASTIALTLAGDQMGTVPGGIDVAALRTQIEAGRVSLSEASAFGLACADRELDSRLDVVEMQSGERYAVLQAFDDQLCDTRTVMIFSSVDGKWRHLDTIKLSTLRLDQPLVAFRDVTGSGARDIVVQGLPVDKGTGILQKNVRIYRVLRAKATVIFDEPEYVHFDVRTHRSHYSVDQESVFELDTTIHERQTLKINGASVTRYKECNWDSNTERIRCFEQAPR